jgi:hypothetical protein
MTGSAKSAVYSFRRCVRPALLSQSSFSRPTATPKKQPANCLRYRAHGNLAAAMNRPESGYGLRVMKQKPTRNERGRQLRRPYRGETNWPWSQFIIALDCMGSPSFTAVLS